VAHAQGITKYRYPGTRISSEEARDYLTQLAADVLDPGSFDLLPFELLVKDKIMRTAYKARGAEADAPAADYAERLRELIELDRDKLFSTFRWSELLALTDPEVPPDAFAKVRRRFALLARGLAKKTQRGKTRG